MPNITNLWTTLWTTFTWSLFSWASSPKLVVPVFLGIMLLTLLRKPSLWVKLLRRATLLLLISYLLLTTPPVAGLLVKSLTVFVSERSPELADEIVVLSRPEELGYLRYDLAIQLWKEQPTSQVFVTSLGRVEYAKERFKAAGLPLEALDGTDCAKTTYEEAVSTAMLLQRRNVHKIVLITDPPHMLRSLLTFQAFGFTVSPQIAAFPPELPAVYKSLLTLREYLGLISYAGMGRFREMDLDERNQVFKLTDNVLNCSIKT